MAYHFFFMVVQKDEGSSYGVYFPDLKGCYAAGETQAEAMENGRKSLRIYAEEMALTGKTVPAARSLDDLMSDPEVRGDVADGKGFLIGVPLLFAETKKRVNVTLEPSLIAQVDRVADYSGTSRSDILSIAAWRYIEAESGAVRVDVRIDTAA
jgi:predicted RNase H-like HicB family nuclease